MPPRHEKGRSGSLPRATERATKALHVMLTPAELEAFRAESEAAGDRSVSAMVRRLVTAAIAARAGAPPSAPEPTSPAMLALQELTIGGEFAAWVRNSDHEIGLPFAAVREFDEATALVKADAERRRGPR